MHGNMSQEERDLAEQKFRSDKSCHILVCTDIISRGHDSKVDLVIQYDLPFSRSHADQVKYIHSKLTEEIN